MPSSSERRASKPASRSRAAGDDVVPLVRVLADRGEVDVERGTCSLHRERQFLLRQVGRVETDVVRPARHRGAVGDGVEEAVGHVADVDEVALEVLLEDDEVAILDGGVHEVVDEQIEPHPRRHAEHRGQPQRDRVRAVEQEPFGLAPWCGRRARSARAASPRCSNAAPVVVP